MREPSAVRRIVSARALWVAIALLAILLAAAAVTWSGLIERGSSQQFDATGVPAASQAAARTLVLEGMGFT
jgi:type II secretory pathway pseudopilin PulG